MRERAVVVGAGVAGLLAACALHRDHAEVVVVERDPLRPGASAFRPGAPQGRHIHGLLIRGARVVETLLPGIREQMRCSGAPVFDMGLATVLCNRGERVGPYATGMELQLFSRRFFEDHLRRRVLELPGVRLMDGVTVNGLLPGASGRVAGVRTRHGPVPAELVVDAAGRSSRTGRWLREFGCQVPADELVDAGAAYATVWLDEPCELPAAGRIVYEFGQFADRGAGGGIALLEDDRPLLMLFGRAGNRPPTDPEGFTAFARDLDNPHLHRYAAAAKHLPVHRYAHMPNRRRPYERARDWPAGLLVAGDAMCVFNPVYGQGMTVAALQAETIARHAPALARDPAAAFAVQRELAARTRLPWLIATSLDSRWTGTPGARQRLIGAGLARMLDRCGDSRHLYTSFFRAQHLVAPLGLLHPGALWTLARPTGGDRHEHT
ncbi:FAD-binding protein [Streptomyces griseocarneus]|nr:FAD-binding protein [Streptomyces griseocarneus]